MAETRFLTVNEASLGKEWRLKDDTDVQDRRAAAPNSSGDEATETQDEDTEDDGSPTVRAPRSPSPPAWTPGGRDDQGPWAGSLVFRVLPTFGLRAGERDTYLRNRGRERTKRHHRHPLQCSADGCSARPARRYVWVEGRERGPDMDGSATLCATHFAQLLAGPVDYGSYLAYSRPGDRDWRDVGDLCGIQGCPKAGHEWTWVTASGKFTIHACDEHAARVAQPHTEPLALRPSLAALCEGAMKSDLSEMHGPDEVPPRYRHLLSHLCLGVGPEFDRLPRSHPHSRARSISRSSSNSRSRSPSRSSSRSRSHSHSRTHSHTLEHDSPDFSQYLPVPTCFRAKHPDHQYCPRDEQWLRELRTRPPKCRLAFTHEAESGVTPRASDPTSGLCAAHRVGYQAHRQESCVACDVTYQKDEETHHPRRAASASLRDFVPPLPGTAGMCTTCLETSGALTILPDLTTALLDEWDGLWYALEGDEDESDSDGDGFDTVDSGGHADEGIEEGKQIQRRGAGSETDRMSEDGDVDRDEFLQMLGSQFKQLSYFTDDIVQRERGRRYTAYKETQRQNEQDSQRISGSR